jgi:hypothetical protein
MIQESTIANTSRLRYKKEQDASVKLGNISKRKGWLILTAIKLSTGIERFATGQLSLNDLLKSKLQFRNERRLPRFAKEMDFLSV